jgi:hypothetical protein
MKFFHRLFFWVLAFTFSGGYAIYAQIPPTALIRVQITYGNSIDEAIVYLHTLATDTFDQDTYDAPKIFSNVDGVPNIMTWLNRNGQWVKLATNGYKSPMTPGCLNVPLGTRATADGNYVLSITEYYGFDSMNIFVSLIDNTPGDTIPFQTIGQQYNYTAINGDSTRGRFILYFCQDYPVSAPQNIETGYSSCGASFWANTFEPDTKEASYQKLEVFDLLGKKLFSGNFESLNSFSSERGFTGLPVIVKVTSDSNVCYRKFVLP